MSETPEVKIKAINDFVFIRPIERKKEGMIDILSDKNTYRRGYIESIGNENSPYTIGDLVVYPDTCKEVIISKDNILHMVVESAIYFKEV